MMVQRVWRPRRCKQMAANILAADKMAAAALCCCPKQQQPHQSTWVCPALQKCRALLRSNLKGKVLHKQSTEPLTSIKYPNKLTALYNQIHRRKPPQHHLVGKGVFQQHNSTFACKSLLWRTSVGHHITTTHLSDKSRVKQGEGAKRGLIGSTKW